MKDTRVGSNVRHYWEKAVGFRSWTGLSMKCANTLYRKCQAFSTKVTPDPISELPKQPFDEISWWSVPFKGLLHLNFRWSQLLPKSRETYHFFFFFFFFCSNSHSASGKCTRTCISGVFVLFVARIMDLPFNGHEFEESAFHHRKVKPQHPMENRIVEPSQKATKTSVARIEV